MWKWLFILLLLGNALMFFWYAQLRANEAMYIAPPHLPVPTIELVDEKLNVSQSKADSVR